MAASWALAFFLNALTSVSAIDAYIAAHAATHSLDAWTTHACGSVPCPGRQAGRQHENKERQRRTRSLVEVSSTSRHQRSARSKGRGSREAGFLPFGCSRRSVRGLAARRGSPSPGRGASGAPRAQGPARSGTPPRPPSRPPRRPLSSRRCCRCHSSPPSSRAQPESVCVWCPKKGHFSVSMLHERAGHGPASVRERATYGSAGGDEVEALDARVRERCGRAGDARRANLLIQAAARCQVRSTKTGDAANPLGTQNIHKSSVS